MQLWLCSVNQPCEGQTDGAIAAGTAEHLLRPITIHPFIRSSVRPVDARPRTNVRLEKGKLDEMLQPGAKQTRRTFSRVGMCLVHPTSQIALNVAVQ